MQRMLLAILFCVSFFSSADAARYISGPSGTATNLANCTWSTYPTAYGYAASDTTHTCTPATVFAGAVAGDTVYFRGGSGGNYNVSPDRGSYQAPKLNPANSGSSGSPITFIAYPGETPIIVNAEHSCTDVSQDECMNPVMGSYGQDYIIIDGFQFGNTQSWSNEGYAAVRFENADNCIARNCVFKNLNNMDGPTYANPASVMLHGDAVGGHNTGTQVTNCYFTGGISSPSNRFNSIIFYNTDGTIIEKITIEDAGAGINMKNGVTNAIVRYSFFRTISTDTYTHIKLGREAGEASDTVDIYQNIFLVAATSNGAIGPYNVCTDINIYNNTFYGPGSTSGYEEQESPDSANVSFWNNLFANLEDNIKFQTTEVPVYCDYNIYSTLTNFKSVAGGTTYSTFSSWQGAGYDAHGARESVTFTNAGGTNPADYKFTSTTKNSGRGGSYASVIGAYITGGEQIGYSPGSTSTRKLNNVTGVRVTLH